MAKRKITNSEIKTVLLTVGTFTFILAISKVIGDFNVWFLGIMGLGLILYTLLRY